MSLTSWVIVGVLVLVALVGTLVLLPALLHRVMSPMLSRRTHLVHPRTDVVLEDLRAVTLGVESKGVTQVRGNGALVLTADELHWFQLIPAREIRIPRSTITAVGTVRSHLGKSYGRDLLHVAYEVDGHPDSIAWYVTDLDAWLKHLRPAA